MLEEVRRRLRALMGLIEPSCASPPLHELQPMSSASCANSMPPPCSAAMSSSSSACAPASFLRAHEDHLTMQRLRRNQPLTPTDLDELKRSCSAMVSATKR